jgi:hypothetical protein
MASIDTTTAFWTWFSAHSAELGAADIPQALIDQLEERLFAIHRLDWEIGPGLETPNLFALSPRGDRSTLVITREIIAQAPKLKGWSFYPAKPPRQWNLVFSLNVDGKEIEIDGKRWQFVAYKFDDGTFDLVFKPDKQEGLSPDYLNWAAIIIADGEIGEERRMDLIGNIEVVGAWDEKIGASAQTLELGLLAKVLSDKR